MMTSYPTPIVAIILGAAVATVILGLILSSYRGSISESSILVRLSLLITLAIGVGVTIFSWFIRPFNVILSGVVSLGIGIPLIFCQDEKKETSGSSIVP